MTITQFRNRLGVIVGGDLETKDLVTIVDDMDKKGKIDARFFLRVLMLLCIFILDADKEKDGKPEEAKANI